ncbi:MAG: hypothetical protein SPL57_07795 [Lachnospiraceae bacterium]|nr:hypothetical protein [Lachnospiraceae bacterium]
MKKGLAIVLAAATALTFAPVSTLGLQGVVEAQAADTKQDASATASVAGTTSVTEGTTDKTLIGSTGTLTLTITNTDSSTDATGVEVSVVSAKGTNATTAGTPASGFTVTSSPVATIAASNGTATVTIAAGSSVTSGNYFIQVQNGFNYAWTPFTYQTAADKDAADAAAADAAAVTAATDATFQNVPDTIYIRDTRDASLTLSPSWVVKKNSSSAENGADLYYQVTTSAPTTSKLLASAYKNTYGTAKTGDTDSTTKVLFDTSKKGSVTLKKDANSTAFAAGDEWLAAYKLNTADNNYTLVGFKKISIQPYENATYDLRLKQAPVTLSLGIDQSSDEVAIDKIFGADGNEISAAGYSIVSVYGDGIESNAFGTASNKNTVAVYNSSTKKFVPVNAGTAKVTVIATNSGKVAVANLNLEVLGTSQYAIKATVDGTKNSAQIGFDSDNNSANGIDSPVILDVKSNNTFDLAKHMYKNNDAIVLSYESSNSKNTVDATTGVVKATTVTDSFYVTVTGKLNGKTVAKTVVYFKVNALPFNELTVTGADKDQATVLNETEYAFTNSKVGITSMTEEKLAASQIKYVQIDVTGKETKEPTEALNIVSTSGAIVTASLVGQTTDGAFKGVSNAGVITLNKTKTSGVAVIKLVSNPTTTTALTTSYIYVVVDKADPKISAADAYKIGTDPGATAVSHESDIVFGEKTGTLKAKVLGTIADDITAEQNLYTADDADKFLKSITTSLGGGNTIYIATAEKKTMHVLLSYTTGDGTAYKVVTITSVPGVHNSVTKIEDATTGKVVYDSAKDSAVAVPELRLDGNTTLKVTLAYAIDKNDTTANISSTSLYYGTAANPVNPLNQNIITATKDEKKADGYTTFYLYPTTQGTQVVTFAPSGDISATDHSITYDDAKQLSITYRESLTLSKVTGLKVANKKGAAVSVSWTKQGTNVLYRVYKKVGSGKWVAKNVAGTKTSLKVKKGAKVTVKVKAYKKTDAGKTVWGPKATQVTKKTDKK